jgi:hypothetical protein
MFTHIRSAWQEKGGIKSPDAISPKNLELKKKKINLIDLDSSAQLIPA